MTAPKLKSLAARIALAFLPLFIAWAPAVHAADVPAQIPLLTKVGTGVAPNIMLTLDDSGSMAFRHMPENVFAGGTFATTNPAGSNTVRWDPSDSYQWTVNTTGTVPGNINSSNYVLKALRSPDTNTIFYNPEIRYQPWLTSNGVTRMANSPPAAAFIDPLVSGTTINLTAYTAPSGSSKWCYTGASTASATGAGCASIANNSASLNHDPGVYFRLKKQTVNAGSFVIGTAYTIVTTGTTNFTLVGAASNAVGLAFTATGVGTGTGVAQGYMAINSSGNYTGYSINSVGPFTKYPSRTCAAALCTLTELTQGFCAGVTCTQAEERQNFANWFTYYRTRNLMVRGSLMEAFMPPATTTDALGNAIVKFRMGFGKINNKNSAAVDGVNTIVIDPSSSSYGGGGVRAFDATRKVQLFNWLGALPANGSTPLVEAMDAIGQYYSRTDSKGPWTDNPGGTNTVANNQTCRRSYNIMATDGYWNGPGVSVGNADNTAGLPIVGMGSTYTYVPASPFMDGTSNTLADVAMKYWKTDLQSAMDNKVPPVGDNISFWQNMTNFTIGLGVKGTLDPKIDLPALIAGTKSWPAATSSTLAPNIDDLWHAAINSRGTYFSAKDPQELANAITTALAGATGSAGATAGVATASTVLESTNRKYVPNYVSGAWNGDIRAVPLDINGQAGTTVWNAAARMPAWSARNIVTWDTGLSTPAAVTFNWASLSSANQAALGLVAAAYTTQFMDFLRGSHANEGMGQPFRARLDSTGNPFILGDFVNSNPVLVKGSFDGGYSGLGLGGATGYQDFLTAKAARDAVLFAGGNDGMLHAFKDTKAATPASALTDGQEVFAYVPRAVYPNLYMLTDPNYGLTVAHHFYVDGPQRESDAYVKAPGASTASWRNYLTGSLGGGGRAVYALDVTNSASLGATSVRWEISSANDGDLGYVMSPIEVGVLPNGKWVAIFGNGLSSSNGYATLFVVDLETAAITKLNVETASGSNGLGGVAVLRDANGQITNLYAGDLKGKLWKLDYDASVASKFKISGSTALFTATDSSSIPQPITATPAIFDHSLGGKIIVFGTGKLFSTTDGADTSSQTIYGVWDKPADSMIRPLSRAALAVRTLTTVAGTGGASSSTFYGLTGTAVDWTLQRGWYIDEASTLPGGRVIYPVQAVSYELALVSLVAPVQGTPAACDSSTGIGIDLTLPVEGGFSPAGHMYDTNGDGAYDSTDATVVGYKTNADGIDSIVHSASINGPNNVADGACAAGWYRVSIQNTTGQVMTCVRRQPPPAGAGPAGTRQFDRVWRRIINPPIH
jgi:type IV pilus assembly protein PilY1